MNIFYVLILVACGVACFLLILGLFEAWNGFWHPRYKLLDQRMHQMFKDERFLDDSLIVNHRPLSRIPWLNNVLQRVPGVHGLDKFLRQADIPMDVSQTLVGALVLTLMSVILGFVLNFPVVLTVLLVGMVLSIAVYYLKRHRTRRLVAIEKQLPDALDLMVRALQSGHAFASSLQLTASESARPLSAEFQWVFDEINLGMGMKSAMGNLAMRVDSKDIRYFVVAVLIQNDTGGNLADVLRKTSTLIRERQKIAGVVRVLSAEGRISAWILSVLPFLLAVALYLINPEFISMLWREQMGQMMLGISVSLMLVGIFWMSRLVVIKV